MSVKVNESKIREMLEYLRMMAFEECTEGDDNGWDKSTNFAVTVGSKILDILDVQMVADGPAQI